MSLQTSPLSLIPKLGKPGKFRLIRNPPYPRNLSDIHSINLSIKSDLYPRTWGTFPQLPHSSAPSPRIRWEHAETPQKLIELSHWPRNKCPGIVITLSKHNPSDPKPFAPNTCTGFRRTPQGAFRPPWRRSFWTFCVQRTLARNFDGWMIFSSSWCQSMS